MWPHSFLSTTLYGSEPQLHATAGYPPGREPSARCIGVYVFPRFRLYILKNRQIAQSKLHKCEPFDAYRRL